MLIDTVRQTIRAHDLIHRGDHIVLGLSGGPDSVCLFHILQRLAPDLELTIHPVHVNHQLRPDAADRDQRYVEDICARAAAGAAGVPSGFQSPSRPAVRPCRTFVIDCLALARARGQTSEEAGRQARYEAFVQVARDIRDEYGPSRVVIAVAHNAGDQAETILHRILRGTGTDGLAGIAYQRYEGEFPVVRPLLDVSRDEIEAYCADQRLDPVLDHTNQEPLYMRNRIRLELLPMLEQYNKNITGSLTRLGRIAAADREYLWQQTEKAYGKLQLWEDDKGLRSAIGDVRPRPEGPDNQLRSEDPADQKGNDRQSAASVVLDREGLAGLPEAIRHRVIARAFHETGLTSDISEERLRAADAIIARKQAPKTVEFPRGHRLTVKQGKAIFR